MHDALVHLTNSSIQKDVTGASIPGLDSAAGGTKCALSALRRRLSAAGIDTDTLWSRITDVVLRSLLAVSDTIPNHPNCFELFGYDVLVDAQLKPWLIEVNSSPSLARENPLDVLIKEALVADTISIVSPPYASPTTATLSPPPPPHLPSLYQVL